MGLFLAIFALGTLSPAQMTASGANTVQNAVSAPSPSTSPKIENPNDMLVLPQGKSTVIGGTISSVDPVMDRLTLKVFGGRPMRILFDERTEVYRDGVKTSLRDLHANDHASVETMLDGTSVFARSIHTLSRSPAGECQGQVVGYEPGTRELTLNESLSGESIRLQLPQGTPIVREGQAASSTGSSGVSDLVKGTLISATFASDNKGGGIASRIAVLAVPGSEISFAGNVTYLDLRARQFAVADAQSDHTYKIFFDPARFPETKDLREGASVKVIANFDGTRYVASSIKIN